MEEVAALAILRTLVFVGKDLPARYLAAEGYKEAVTPHAQGPSLAVEGHARLNVPPPGPGVGLGVCQPLPQGGKCGMRM